MTMLLYPPPDLPGGSNSYTTDHKPDTTTDNREHHCTECGDCFQSPLMLQQHRIYTCKNGNNNAAVFAQLNREFIDRHRNQSFSHQLGDNTQSSMESGLQSADSDDGMSETSSYNSERWKGVEGEDGERHFPCDHCDKTFTDPSNLQRHIRSQHVGARSHACKECGKTFATSSGLKQHQHIHSSVKPFQCEVCLKAYTQFSNLCRHKRMHADCRQQIKCKDCGQAFSTVTSLSKHKRFCEGAIRNGSSLPFQGHVGTVLPKPTSMRSVGLTSPTSHTSLPSNYLNFYTPRPPYPFYPPIHASFPTFPPTHPLAAMQMAALSGMNNLLPHAAKSMNETLSIPNVTPIKKNLGSDGNGSDLSPTTSNSDCENRHSDIENDDKKSPSISSYPKLRIPTAPVHPKLSPIHASMLPCRPHHFPEQPFDLSKESLKKNSVSPIEKPFDLSKVNIPKHGDNNMVTNGTEKPLDLTVKNSQTTSHKTHVFGEQQESTKTPPKPAQPQQQQQQHQQQQQQQRQHKLPIGYPFPNPLMLDPMYRVDQAKYSTFQEATKMMAYAQHQQRMAAMASTNSPYNSLAALGYTSPIKDLPTMMKLAGKSNEPHHHHHQFSPYTAKMKERYSCKFCGKIFPRSANLTRHLRTHTGEQPYKCKYCERSFSISSNLQRHVRNIHNKEKPFKCALCDRCFGQQTNLDRHLKKHESDGPIVVDSPPNHLEEKDDSYFDEIRNFIDKTDSESVPKAPYSLIDSSFSLTSHVIEKKDGGDGGVTGEKSFDEIADDEEDIDVDDDDDDDNISVTGDLDDEIPAITEGEPSEGTEFALTENFTLSPQTIGYNSLVNNELRE